MRKAVKRIRPNALIVLPLVDVYIYFIVVQRVTVLNYGKGVANEAKACQYTAQVQPRRIINFLLRQSRDG